MTDLPPGPELDALAVGEKTMDDTRVSRRLLQGAGDDPEARINLLAANLDNHARLLREARADAIQLQAACVSALSALRARREVEEHTAAAAQYDNCPDCCNQRPCPEFARLETAAQSASATAMAALRGALAKEKV